MKPVRISRRNFLRLGALSLPSLLMADGFLIEPEFIRVRNVSLSSTPTRRFVHISDIHHKGEANYLKKVVARINRLSPDFTCFTGDIVERKNYLDEALDILSGLKAPVFGVPGNHDYWSGSSFKTISKCLESTGGGLVG